MTLNPNTPFPPGGFYYREPSIGWVTGNPMLPLVMVARELQQARMNNLASGLDTTLQACQQAIEEFTCKRIKGDPKYCSGSEVPKSEVKKTKVTGKCAGCR